MKVFTSNFAARAMRPFITNLSGILLVLLFTLCSSWAVAQTATITTDQLDYAPGTTATFTGAGFGAGRGEDALVSSGPLGGLLSSLVVAATYCYCC